jgi:hypothetical protein
MASAQILHKNPLTRMQSKGIFILFNASQHPYSLIDAMDRDQLDRGVKLALFDILVGNYCLGEAKTSGFLDALLKV